MSEQLILNSELRVELVAMAINGRNTVNFGTSVLISVEYAAYYPST